MPCTLDLWDLHAVSEVEVSMPSEALVELRNGHKLGEQTLRGRGRYETTKAGVQRSFASEGRGETDSAKVGDR